MGFRAEGRTFGKGSVVGGSEVGVSGSSPQPLKGVPFYCCDTHFTGSGSGTQEWPLLLNRACFVGRP